MNTRECRKNRDCKSENYREKKPWKRWIGEVWADNGNEKLAHSGWQQSGMKEGCTGKPRPQWTVAPEEEEEKGESG
jgi:hypothetical protein